MVFGGAAAESVAGEGERRRGAERGRDDGVQHRDINAVPACLQQPIVGRQRLEPDQIELERQAVERRAVEGQRRHHEDRHVEEQQHQDQVDLGDGAADRALPATHEKAPCLRRAG
jgi:hypothetical protein